MKNIFTLTTIALSFLFCAPSLAQMEVNLLSKWDYQRKATIHEKINKVIATSNGFIVAVGETINPSLQHIDGLFMVIDAEEGKEVRRKSFGGSGDNSFNSVVQNHDGTFTLVGYTRSGKKSDQDGWIIRVDLEGELLFEDKPASPDKKDDVIKEVAISPQGKVLAAGVQKTKKSTNIWLLNIGKEEVTSQPLGHGELGRVEGLVAASDESFVLLGSTTTLNKNHPEDAWVLKVDEQGQDQWGGVKFFGDRNLQEGLGITHTIDGGYAIAGVTNSKGAGMSDKWLIKLNQDGEQEWDQTYGKAYEDIATSVIELSEGGFAVFGQTKSYMPNATTTMLELLITDEKGRELESNTYPIYEATGNETAHSLVEMFNGDLIIAGSSASQKHKTATLYIGAYTYKNQERQPNSVKSPTDRFGNNTGIQEAIILSEPAFFDRNGNRNLESGERGYFALEIRNQSTNNLNNISSLISTDGSDAGIDFWKDIKVGTLRAGQTKRLLVPVHAIQASPKGDLNLTLDVEVEGRHATSAAMSLKSSSHSQPDPARLAINRSSFVPGSAPSPGVPIRLTIEIVNTGELAAQSSIADFEIPPGVRSTDSERQQIPALRPRQTHTVVFSFTYEASYQQQTIPITFKTEGQGINLLKKTFHLNVNNAAPSEPVVAGRIPDEMVWASPDPSEYQSRTVPINQKDVDIKVIALSKKQLTKTKFNVLVNGKRHQGQKMDEARLGPPTPDAGRNRQSYSHKVRLAPGVNNIQIVYQHEDGSEFKSPPITVEYQPKGNPNLYVYSIGVEHDDLKYTTKDARDIANEFKKLYDEKGRGFRKIDIKAMTRKEETTVLNIRNSFIDLTRQNIKENDLVVIFISSHGKVDQNRDFILMPSDFDARYEETTSINFKEDILNKLKLLDANILVMIDACHSGGALLGSRDFEEATSKVMTSLIEASSGVEVIASCSEDEYSYEDDSWGNGAFTKAILEAFRNEKVKIDGRMIQADIYGDHPETLQKERRSDGAITIEELIEFVKQRVPYLVEVQKNKKQNPTHKSLERLPRDMGVFYSSYSGKQ